MATFSRSRRMALARIGVALGTSILAGYANAALEWGKDYVPVRTPQPSQTPGKIEVVEFFSYACPHCYHLEPILGSWAKHLPRDVAFHRAPVAFQDSIVPLARAYYTAESMGILNRLHPRLFEAIHEQHLSLSAEKALMEWVKGQGVDAKRFADVYHSFGVEAGVSHARQLAQAYEIDAVPTLVVGGKYLTSAAMAGSQEALPRVLSQLIDQVRQGG